MQANIKIKDIAKFTEPLNALKSSINSIILSIVDDTLHVDMESDDSSQKSNIWFKKEIVEVEENDDVEKLGIYNLSEFLSVLSLYKENEIDIKVKDNKIVLKHGKKSQIEYVLTDLELITEGPVEPKAEILFEVEFEVESGFIKKVKDVSRSLNVNILKFIVKKNKLIYKIVDKNNQSHNFTEALAKCDCDDFDVSICLKDENRSNIDLLLETDYKISLHERIICLEAKNDDYEKVRYYLAPLATED